MKKTSSIRWLLKFFISTSLSLFLLVSSCFLIMHAIPGDPFQDEQGIPEEIVEHLKERWGLNKPIHEQYFHYLNRVLHGDLGISIRYPSQSVLEIITNGFPVSAILGFQAIALSIPLGALLGMIWAYCIIRRKGSIIEIDSREAACRRNPKFADLFFSISSTAIVSTPNFVIAALLQLVFALWIPLFPVARWGSLSHTVLPTLALTIGPLAMIIRLSKARALDIYTQEWVTMARMKGLSELKILINHVCPHVILPILSYLGPVITNLLVGSFAIERVFGIPGLGQWFVNSILTRDYPVIAGLTLFYSLILFSCHTLVDLLTICIDGRKRKDFGRSTLFWLSGREEKITKATTVS